MFDKKMAGNIKNQNNQSEYNRLFYLSLLIAAFGIASFGFFYMQNQILKQRIYALEDQISKMDNTFSYNVDDGRKIYVFDIDKAIEGIGLHETSHKFEEDIYSLDQQVKEAQETIKDIKEEKVKNKVLNLSIKPLQMKRDELLEAYSKSTQSALNNINKALAEIAAGDNIPTIFMNKSVAVNTNYVIDVTDRVIEKVKQATNNQ